MKQLPAFDWQPVNLKARLEGNFPQLFKAGQGLREDERARLHDLIEAIKICLEKPANESQKAEMLNFLFNALQWTTKNHNRKQMLDLYRFALEGIPYAVLRKAIGDIVRGQADGLSRVFLPTTAELVHYCHSLITKAQGCIAAAQRLLNTPEAAPRTAEQPISTTRMQELKQQMRLAAKLPEKEEAGLV